MKITRTSLRMLACVMLALAACATTAQNDAARFTSDRISVVTRGSGRDIILVHGLGGSRDLWADAAATLDDRYRLHLVQINGFGGTPAPATTDSLVAAPVAAEIARYIRETGIRQPAVIGHSMGGTIAMMVAARNPGVVGRLMVIDMPPFMGAVFGVPAGTAADMKPFAAQVRTEILTVPFDSTMFAKMIPAMTFVDSMRPVLLQLVRASDRRMVANAFHEIILTDLRQELPRINVPMSVLYVVPADVPLTPDQFDASMKELFRNAPHARLVRIDNARHFLQYDQPARFIAEVDGFMR